MRRIVRYSAALVAFAATMGGAVVYWRRNPRVGTAFVNSVVNPGLLRRGLAGAGASELGTLEHFGRRSGTRRLTPVHPEPTADGFRIVVPLGEQSEWARNVLAAGHCRVQLHDQVYDLDEPAMICPCDAEDLPNAVRSVMAKLGFKYLKLRTFGVNPGALEPVEVEADIEAETKPDAEVRMPAEAAAVDEAESSEPEPVTTGQDLPIELVSSSS